MASSTFLTFYLCGSLVFLSFWTGETCNALDNPELLQTTDDLASFDSELISGENRKLEVLFPSKLQGSRVRIVEVDTEDGTGDVAGSFWLREKRRLADGFDLEFSFSITGNSDGLAVVLQNDQIQDIEGNVGSALGFKNGIDRFLAVSLDICVDRLACLGDAQISVVADPDTVLAVASIAAEDIKKDGSVVHRMKITYARLQNVIKVVLDGTTVLQDSLGVVSAEQIFDDRFAFVGFTGSNLGATPADIDIHSLKVAEFISESRLRDGTESKEVQIGTAQIVTVEFVDLCNLVSAQAVAQNNISLGSFSAKLVLQASPNPLEFSPGFVRQVSSTTFELLFDITFLGDYTLEVEVEGVKVQGTPLPRAFIGVDRLEFPPYAIGLLASLLAILVIASVMAVRRFVVYRSRLNEYKDAIEGGIEAAKLQELDKHVDYRDINPMLGNLAVLKEQLEKNQEELRRLRNRTAPLQDGEQTLAQLKKENAKLRKRLNEIKRQKQMQEAFYVRRTLLAFVPAARRREIAQESVREGRNTRIRQQQNLQRVSQASEEKEEEDVKESIEQQL